MAALGLNVAIHFDTDHLEGRFVGDGTIVEASQRRFLVEVTSPGTHELSLGERMWIPKRDCFLR